MANHKSAAKKARRDVEARLRNRSNRSTLKSAVKTFLALITVGKKGRYEIIRDKLHWAGWVKER